MPMKHVPAVIVAAGSSSRLGRPKQLVLMDGETLLARAIRIAHDAGASPVFVVLGAHREEIEAAVDFASARIVTNESWPEGLASSIRAGLAALEKDASTAPAVLLMLCDQPRVTAEHLRKMMQEFQGSKVAAIASLYAGKRGIPAIFPREAFADLLALAGDQGARGLLADPSRQVIEVALAGGEVDVDRPEDLASLC
jgi:molybdenum cofactor cytidylyltransferase